MIHQAPAGARDLLPLEVAQKGWINDRLQQVFARWGYQRIVTSTLEWLDTLTAGGAIQPSSVIQLQNPEGGLPLGLRPELTASIARAAVTRMAGNTYPQRLCYRANVFRRPDNTHQGKQLEFYQAGVELLFAGGILADAEIILLIADSLKHLGIEGWQLILGEVGLTRALLAGFPPELLPQVRHCIAHMDRLGLAQLNLSPELYQRALLVFDLRGEPQGVLTKVARLELPPAALAIVNNLKTLIELIQQQAGVRIVLDLSLLQTIDYYTGIVFQIVSYHNRQWQMLGQGGRYDQLLGLYHPQGHTAPGIGFAFNIEDLHACLQASDNLPPTAIAPDWLVIATCPEAINNAFSYAQKLRETSDLVRVELDLGGKDPEEIREYARSCHIRHLAWLNPEGLPTLESL